MFIARKIGMGLAESCPIKSPSEICAVLDTDDCVVEYYPYSKILQMADSFTIFGVVDSGEIRRSRLRNVLDGEINLKNTKEGAELCLFSDTILYIQDKGRAIILRDSLLNEIGSIRCDRILSKPEMYIVWAEKLGNQGYRFVIEIQMFNVQTNHYFIAHIYTVMYGSGDIGIERIEYNTTINAAVWNDTESIPASLLSRLSLMGTI